MATLSSEILRVCCIRPTNRCSILGRRFLFSSGILGIENFKRISIFEKDKVLDKTDFVDKLAHNRYAASFRDRRLVHDLVKLIYITEEQSEVALMTDLLRQLSCNRVDTKEPSVDALNGRLNLEGPLSPKRFQVGPLVFRLLHILKDIHTAQMLYHDKVIQLEINVENHSLITDVTTGMSLGVGHRPIKRLKCPIHLAAWRSDVLLFSTERSHCPIRTRFLRTDRYLIIFLS